jgi:hypothetical protein
MLRLCAQPYGLQDNCLEKSWLARHTWKVEFAV